MARKAEKQKSKKRGDGIYVYGIVPADVQVAPP
jgi:hypothetical protein